MRVRRARRRGRVRRELRQGSRARGGVNEDADSPLDDLADIVVEPLLTYCCTARIGADPTGPGARPSSAARMDARARIAEEMAGTAGSRWGALVDAGRRVGRGVRGGARRRVVKGGRPRARRFGSRGWRGTAAPAAGRARGAAVPRVFARREVHVRAVGDDVARRSRRGRRVALDATEAPAVRAAACQFVAACLSTTAAADPLTLLEQPVPDVVPLLNDGEIWRGLAEVLVAAAGEGARGGSPPRTRPPTRTAGLGSEPAVTDPAAAAAPRRGAAAALLGARASRRSSSASMSPRRLIRMPIRITPMTHPTPKTTTTGRPRSPPRSAPSTPHPGARASRLHLPRCSRGRTRPRGPRGRGGGGGERRGARGRRRRREPRKPRAVSVRPRERSIRAGRELRVAVVRRAEDRVRHQRRAADGGDARRRRGGAGDSPAAQSRRVAQSTRRAEASVGVPSLRAVRERTRGGPRGGGRPGSGRCRDERRVAVRRGGSAVLRSILDLAAAGASGSIAPERRRLRGAGLTVAATSACELLATLFRSPQASTIVVEAAARQGGMGGPVGARLATSLTRLWHAQAVGGERRWKTPAPPPPRAAHRGIRRAQERPGLQRERQARRGGRGAHGDAASRRRARASHHRVRATRG